MIRMHVYLVHSSSSKQPAAEGHVHKQLARDYSYRSLAITSIERYDPQQSTVVLHLADLKSDLRWPISDAVL
jgi:hypothetical protein